jgi:hypothetical protein
MRGGRAAPGPSRYPRFMGQAAADALPAGSLRARPRRITARVLIVFVPLFLVATAGGAVYIGQYEPLSPAASDKRLTLAYAPA